MSNANGSAAKQYGYVIQGFPHCLGRLILKTVWVRATVGAVYPHPKLVASLPAAFDAAFGRRRRIGKVWLWRNLRPWCNLWLRRIRRFRIRALPRIIVVRGCGIAPWRFEVLRRTLHFWRRGVGRLRIRIRFWIGGRTRIVIRFWIYRRAGIIVGIRGWTGIVVGIRRRTGIGIGLWIRRRTGIGIGLHRPSFIGAGNRWFGRNRTRRGVDGCIQVGIFLRMRFKIDLLRWRFGGLCHQ